MSSSSFYTRETIMKHICSLSDIFPILNEIDQLEGIYSTLNTQFHILDSSEYEDKPEVEKYIANFISLLLVPLYN